MNLNQSTEFINLCNLNKIINSTEYNEKRPRNYTIIQIKKRCCLYFTDLADSERDSNNTLRRAESAFINKPLLALCTVINNLLRNQQSGFKDSK